MRCWLATSEQHRSRATEQNPEWSGLSAGLCLPTCKSIMGLRPRFKTPFSQARDKLLAYAIRPLMVFQATDPISDRLQHPRSPDDSPAPEHRSSGFTENYKLGDVLGDRSSRPPISRRSMLPRLRDAKPQRENHSPCFQFRFESRGNFSPEFSFGMGRSEKTDSRRPDKSPVWSGEGGPAVAQAIIAHKFNEADLDRLAAIIREIGAGYIYDDGDAERLQQEIVLVDVRNPAAQVIVPAPQNENGPALVSAPKSRAENRQSSRLVGRTKDRTHFSTAAVDSSQRSSGRNGYRGSQGNRSQPYLAGCDFAETQSGGGA